MGLGGGEFAHSADGNDREVTGGGFCRDPCWALALQGLFVEFPFTGDDDICLFESPVEAGEFKADVHAGAHGGPEHRQAGKTQATGGTCTGRISECST